MKYIYLHGFASSPLSAKAVYLSDRFATLGIPLDVPDLNQGDFSHLTITRQSQQVQVLFPSDGTPVTLIGSSLGGLTSAFLAQNHTQVQRLILLAPAFGFLAHWLPQLTLGEVHQWQKSGYLPVYHYGEEQSLPLHQQFVQDASQYQETQLMRAVPTLILHGQHDEVIPLEASRDYAKIRSWVQLIELDSDHNLNNVMLQIWEATQAFCQLA